MNPRPTDFFRYQAATPESETWGVVVTGTGRFCAQPGRPYPPAGHPTDHHFTWDRGRILGAFQVVYIAEGRGEFESEATGRMAVGAGSALLLFPGCWHRYRPEPETGWTEHWVELGGELVQRLLREKTLPAGQPVVALSRRLEFEARLETIAGLMVRPSAGQVPELAGQALGVLALLAVARTERLPVRPVVAAIAQARRLMEDADDRALAMPAIARKLGVAYSHFRREFRRSTGISPRQYLLRIRMQRAQRLLGSSDETLQQIADRLGFSSPYHLSSAFKAEFGVSPSQWRKLHPHTGVGLRG